MKPASFQYCDMRDTEQLVKQLRQLAATLAENGKKRQLSASADLLSPQEVMGALKRARVGLAQHGPKSQHGGLGVARNGITAKKSGFKVWPVSISPADILSVDLLKEAVMALINNGFSVRSPNTQRVLNSGDQPTEEDLKSGLILVRRADTAVSAANNSATKRDAAYDALLDRFIAVSNHDPIDDDELAAEFSSKFAHVEAMFNAPAKNTPKRIHDLTSALTDLESFLDSML